MKPKLVAPTPPDDGKRLLQCMGCEYLLRSENVTKLIVCPTCKGMAWLVV